MKAACVTIAALFSLCWAAEEVKSYEESRARVGEDGWVLLCYGADWDRIYDEKWMRRQTAIRSASGNALIMYVPVWQNPNDEQRQQAEEQLRGLDPEELRFSSLPCAVLLDAQGHPYKVIEGEAFHENVAGQIRYAQTQLRTRCDLWRQASREEGSVRAQTLGRIWRLSIAPPPGLREMMSQADPQDSAGLAAISPFDAWDFARRVQAMSWEEGNAEIDRMLAMPISNEERQAVLAVHMGRAHAFKLAAGAREVRELAAVINSLGSTPLAKAATRAAELWGSELSLKTGWGPGLLPRVEAACEFGGTYNLSLPGAYRFTIVVGPGEDTVRVRGLRLYDGSQPVAEDMHDCELRYKEAVIGNSYNVQVTRELMHPRVEIIFDQRDALRTSGRIVVQYRGPEDKDFALLDTSIDSKPRTVAPPPPRKEDEAVKESGGQVTKDYIALPDGVTVGSIGKEGDKVEDKAAGSTDEPQASEVGQGTPAG